MKTGETGDNRINALYFFRNQILFIFTSQQYKSNICMCL